MVIKLREYQQDAIKRLRDGFKSHKRQVLCSPTGSGKTVIFSEIARQVAYKNKQVLIVTDRQEILSQIINATKSLKPAFIIASQHSFTPSMVNIAMVETLSRRPKIIEALNPSLLIIDEAHMASFNKIIDKFPNCYVIGATATPIGKHFHKYYSNLIDLIQIPELQSQGYLSRYKAVEMRGQDWSALKKVGGEYTDETQMNIFNKPKLYKGLIEQVQKHIQHRKTIIYCINIEHATHTCDELVAQGYAAEVVTGATPRDERASIFARFKTGLFQFLINVGVATKGYDEPSIEAVIMYRKTASLALYLQCVGRGGRTNNGKDYFVHLDFGENITEHGLWNQHREWFISPPKDKKLKGEAPIRHCPQCDAVIAAQSRECEWCGFNFPKQERKIIPGVDVVVTDANLIQRTISQLSLDELRELMILKKYTAHYIWRIVRTKGAKELLEFANICGYKKGWIDRQLSEPKGFKDSIIRL